MTRKQRTDPDLLTADEYEKEARCSLNEAEGSEQVNETWYSLATAAVYALLAIQQTLDDIKEGIWEHERKADREADR